MRLFETFWIAPKGPPSFVSIFCNTMDVEKSQRVPPFTFSGTVTLFKKFLGNFFHVPKGFPLQFLFSFFATSWSFTKPEGSPFSILSLRYGADFGRSRLVFPGVSCRRIKCTVCITVGNYVLSLTVLVISVNAFCPVAHMIMSLIWVTRCSLCYL